MNISPLPKLPVLRACELCVAVWRACMHVMSDFWLACMHAMSDFWLARMHVMSDFMTCIHMSYVWLYDLHLCALCLTVWPAFMCVMSDYMTCMHASYVWLYDLHACMLCLTLWLAFMWVMSDYMTCIYSSLSEHTAGTYADYKSVSCAQRHIFMRVPAHVTAPKDAAKWLCVPWLAA